VPLSELDEELKIQWRKQLFANAAMAFDRPEAKGDRYLFKMA
jgi:hypothetical protein